MRVFNSSGGRGLNGKQGKRRENVQVQALGFFNKGLPSDSRADIHCDDSFPRFRRKTHCQLLMMGDQICAGLRRKPKRLKVFFFN